VRAGEIFTMVGPNGAGKSTLFNLISGLETPTAGSILIMGRDFAQAPIHERAPLMGRSFQVARLVPELTVLENVMVRLDQIFPDLSEAQIAARALAQLQAFDLQNLAYRQVRELSAGQHKLIDLARASAGDPPLLLLDEPAVGLGEEELEHLARLLARLRAQGSAIVIVEHNINFVRRVADRGVVLDSGLPIASGAIADILADKAVQDAYFGALT
jgi:branched-chain amino acid transport system permease protein